MDRDNSFKVASGKSLKQCAAKIVQNSICLLLSKEENVLKIRYTESEQICEFYAAIPLGKFILSSFTVANLPRMSVNPGCPDSGTWGILG